MSAQVTTRESRQDNAPARAVGRGSADEWKADGEDRVHMTDDGARRILAGDDGDEAMMAEDARSTLLFQLSCGADSELPDLDQCAREDAEMQRRTAQAIAAREEARQHDEPQDVDLEQAMADWRHAQQQRLQELLAAASAEVADSTPDLLSLTGLGLSDADEPAAALGEQLGAVDKGPPRVPLSMEAVAATEAERSDAAAARQERQQRDNVRAELQARGSARLAMVRDLMGGGRHGGQCGRQCGRRGRRP